jgi:amino acid transporter
MKGEEAKNPKKSIPISIIGSLFICCLLNCGVCAVLTLMIPYYLIDEVSPVFEVLRYVNMDWASYVVSIGVISGMMSW